MQLNIEKNMMNNNDYLESLEKRIKYLEDRLNGQILGPQPNDKIEWPQDWGKNIEDENCVSCGKCGMKIEAGKPTWYYCGNLPCPMGLGGTII